jgi:RimJ/RimL family protein N-acetyltransferase
VERESGDVIGDCGPAPVLLPDGRTEIELGWHIRRDLQGCGYGTEAARAWLEPLAAAGVPRSIALVRPENLASRRVAEKVGMTVRERILWNAELRWPHLVYAMDLTPLRPTLP